LDDWIPALMTEFMKHRIYIKTEPAGRIVCGRLNEDQTNDFEISLIKGKLLPSLLSLRHNKAGNFAECSGVINTGNDGDIGNIGLIQLAEKTSHCLVDESKSSEGIYFCHLALSKASVEFEVDLFDGAAFNAMHFVEISIPVKLPDCVSHHVYGSIDFNVVQDYLYLGKPIDDYLGVLTHRGYSEQTSFFKLAKKTATNLYVNSDGLEIWR
jgi:hypothetical protein